MKTIFHIDEQAKWELTLANAKNLLNYAAEEGVDLEAEILANSKAVLSLAREAAVEQDMLETVEELLDAGVRVVACRNALKKEGVTEADLITGIGIVPAGVAELTLKQAEGFAYIRP